MSGIANGTGASGNTAWNNSVRSRLYFETVKAPDGEEPDPNLRTLTTKKANYARQGDQIAVTNSNGAFVAKNAGGSLDRSAREN